VPDHFGYKVSSVSKQCNEIFLKSLDRVMQPLRAPDKQIAISTLSIAYLHAVLLTQWQGQTTAADPKKKDSLCNTKWEFLSAAILDYISPVMLKCLQLVFIALKWVKNRLTRGKREGGGDREQEPNRQGTAATISLITDPGYNQQLSLILSQQLLLDPRAYYFCISMMSSTPITLSTKIKGTNTVSPAKQKKSA